MCSWCWGFAQVLAALETELPPEIPLQFVMGGLSADTNTPMEQSIRTYVQDNWRSVEATTGASFNWEFWDQCNPRRSTYPACRAVIAAALCGKGPAMFHAIQRAYYLEARNPSDIETLVELAVDLELNSNQFRTSIQSVEVEALLQRDFDTRRKLGVNQFPTLLFGPSIESNLDQNPGQTILLARGYAPSNTVLDAFRRAYEKL